MICKEDITVMFKGLEGDERIELMCSLLDCCLPLELRFLGTYIEYAANKHYSNLQRYEKTANDATFGQLKDLHDATIRRKFCIYLALLYSHNKRAATDLFKFLEHFKPDESLEEKENNLTVNGVICTDDETYINEIKLLFSMGSCHPAFTFEQKEILRSKITGKEETKDIDDQIKIEDETEQITNDIPEAIEQPVQLKDAEAKNLPTAQCKELSSNASIKKSPQITKGLNEMNFASDFSSLSLASGSPSSNPVTRMPLATESHTTHLVEAFQYQPLQIPAIFPQNPSLMGVPFQNIQGIQPPMNVYPTSPRSQVPPNMQSMMVSPSMQGKPGGVAQGPNGLIHTIYPTQMFGNSVPPPAPAVGCNQSEYRFASSPIPVRPTRLFRPLGPGPNTGHQSASYGYNMSPYQSPMDSPVASPFTSPSPSPKSSPLPSPRLSPFPSPAESPMFRRKFPNLSARRNSDHYGSVFDWLKSLRLHKYSEIFKDYTFDQMKVLTEADLSSLGLTQGARKKFSLHINNLIEKGFKGFGNHLGSTENMKLAAYNFDVAAAVARTGSSSEQNQAASSLLGMQPGTSRAGGPIAGKAPVFFDQMGNQLPLGTTVLDASGKVSMDHQARLHHPSDYVPRRDENFIEKSSDEGSQSTCESIEDLTSDDEVFTTRRPTVIENKDCFQLKASCYNCGSKDHFGEQCIEQTMEEGTYIRYGYHLNYNTDRLKENKR